MIVNLNHQNIFFLGDPHYFHKNIILYDKRGFKDVDEMNEKLVENWNSVVSDTDVVFLGGDLSWASFRKTKEIVDKLKGKIYFVMGNHDYYKDIVKFDRFENIYDKIDLYVDDKDTLDLDKTRGTQHIILDHYPILSWNRMRYNSIHLHFHTHGSLEKSPNYEWYYKNLVMDCGANCINFTPISYQEVKDIMSKKPNLKLVDKKDSVD